MSSPSRLGDAHRTLREIVADEIRAMIRNRQLEPGERLLEDRLAEQLGVSRNPVREAIRALENTGLVEVRPRRGAYVATLDPDRAVELLELRSVLEAFAAQLAAHRPTPEQLAEIRHWFVVGRDATAVDDLVHAAHAHRQFHLAIERAADNSYLGPAVEPLRAQTELLFSMLVDILTAIEAGDADAAQRATRRHMSSVLNDLRRSAEGAPATVTFTAFPGHAGRS